MRAQLIDELLRGAGLETLGRDELLAIAKSSNGPVFGEALRKLERNNPNGARTASFVVRAHGKAMRAGCRAWGLHYDQEQLVKLSLDEGEAFFIALGKHTTSGTQANIALAYLVGLGMRKVSSTAHGSPTEPPYYSFKLFGSNAALCISEALTRGTGMHTIQIEVAGALGNSRQFDWQSKIILQLSEQECYELVALLQGHTSSLAFKGHGTRHDKALYIERQSGKLFFKVVQEGRSALALPVPAFNAMPLMNLLFGQIQKNHPHLTVAQVTANLSALALLLK